MKNFEKGKKIAVIAAGVLATAGVATLAALPNIVLKQQMDENYDELSAAHDNLQKRITYIIDNTKKPDAQSEMSFLESGISSSENELKNIEFHPEPDNERLVLSCDYQMQDLNKKVYSYANKISIPLEAEEMESFQAITHIEFSENEKNDWAENNYYRFPIIPCLKTTNQFAYKNYYTIEESTQIYNLVSNIIEKGKELGVSIASVGTELNTEKESKIETKVTGVGTPIKEDGGVSLPLSLAHFDANNPDRDVALFEITINFDSSFAKNPSLVFEGTAQQAIELVKGILSDMKNVYNFSGTYSDYENHFIITISSPVRHKSSESYVESLKNMQEEDLSARAVHAKEESQPQ